MSQNNPKYYESATVKPLDQSQVEITATIAASVWEAHRAQALKNINNEITIDGFRKGMIPENILVSKVGEMHILEEMAELAITRAYLSILEDHKIDAISKPQVSVTKLAKGNPLEFKVVTAVVPEIALPDYKKVSEKAKKAASADELKVTDQDMEDAILRARKSRVSHEGHDHDKLTPEEHDKLVSESLPEFNDAFVQSLGEFKDVADFRAKLKVMLGEQKRDEAREKNRIRIADGLTEATKVTLPEIMIESELDRTTAQFSADIERMGVKLEDYLKHAKKSVEDLRKEWRPHAEKKAKLQLILNAISKAEKLTPTQKEIEQEVAHIVEHYREADRERAAIYAETVLTNEKVFQFLEK